MPHSDVNKHTLETYATLISEHYGMGSLSMASLQMRLQIFLLEWHQVQMSQTLRRGSGIDMTIFVFISCNTVMSVTMNICKYLV